MSCDIGGGQNFNARHFLQSSGMYKITSCLHRHKQSIRVQLCIDVFYKLTISVFSIKTCTKQFVFNLQFVFVAVVNNPYPQTFSILQIYQQSFNNTFPIYVQYVNLVKHVRLVYIMFTGILPNLKKKKIFQENENDDDTGTIVSVTCECFISTLWPLHFCLGNVLSYISKSAFF